MYERFTDRARRVMQLANREAQRFNHEYIGSEHILLGLIGEESGGVAVRVLRSQGISLRSIRSEVEKYFKTERDRPMIGRLFQSPRARAAIQRAIEECHNLGHDCVGTEHLLLGLLGDGKGLAANILMSFGLQLDKVRVEVEKTLAQPEDWGRFSLTETSPSRTIGKVVEVPTTCPKCAGSHIVRVLWHNVFVSEHDRREFDAGRAILGSFCEMEGPAWVCLGCSPRWSEVHDVAMRDYELQAVKQKAVASMDFDTAARHRDAQLELRQRLKHIVDELAKNS